MKEIDAWYRSKIFNEIAHEVTVTESQELMGKAASSYCHEGSFVLHFKIKFLLKNEPTGGLILPLSHQLNSPVTGTIFFGL